MFNLISRYYGSDWVATALTMLAIYLLGNKRKEGFVIMIIGNLCWVALGLIVHSIAMVIANVVFIVMNLRGFMKWSSQG